MESGLARSIGYAREKVQYNDQVKKILSHKTILAWILKYTLEELTEMSLQQIQECIEGEPEISTIKVENGYETERIIGSDTADIVVGEGNIYYDIRFHIYIPDTVEYIKILLNIEAQKDFYPGYQIVTRGIFYGSRMISAQQGTEFEIPDYDGIKKVYSIWLCMNAPRYIGNAISQYSITKGDIVPGIPDNKKSYDKMTIVMICLNEKRESTSILLRMLNVLLSQTKSAEERKAELNITYHIEMDSKLEWGIELMCNLADLVEERGIQRGAGILIKTCREFGVSVEETVIRLMNGLEIGREKAEAYIAEYWKE